MGKSKKIIVDKEKGTYVTGAQLKFFSNRPNALHKIRTEDPEYVEFCISCCSYNIICEYFDRDEEDVEFFWDDEHGFYYSFDSGGDLAQDLVQKGFQLSGTYE